MKFKSINQVRSRGHVGVVQSPYFRFFTRRVKSDKKWKTYGFISILNNFRWISNNLVSEESGKLVPFDKYTQL